MLQVALIWAALALAMMAVAEVCFRAATRHGRGDGPDAVGGVDTIMSATLALTALLLALSFSVAQGHYDERRQLVVAEANAIGTTLLRQQLLAEPDRAQLRPLMRAYVLARRMAVADEPRDRDAAEAQRQTDSLQARIWAVTGQALRTPEGAATITPLLLTTNEMFDAAEAERAAREVRIPDRTLRVLVLLTLGAAGLFGVGLAARRRRELAASTLLFALIALTMSLIYDLDAPSSGGIRTPHESMDRLAQGLS
ncbi:MAG: hypothetical protein ACJ798_00785 [Phenylobacterium sp.]